VTSYLVLDIETVLDPELPIAAPAEVERLPAAPHHRVVVIGFLLLDAALEPRRLDALGNGTDEALILARFAQMLEDRRPCLVTFNGRGFDLPVIAARCLRHGVPLRRYYQPPAVRHRYTPEGHLDLMDYLADFGATKPSRLDVIARLCGMPGKIGVDGKDVGPLIRAERFEEVRSYCLSDVVQTAAIFLRVQFVRGELSREAYLRAMGRLLALVRSDDRLAAVAAAVNEPRLLLGEERGARHD